MIDLLLGFLTGALFARRRKQRRRETPSVLFVTMAQPLGHRDGTNCPDLMADSYGRRN
jgi:hypothetical protein